MPGASRGGSVYGTKLNDAKSNAHINGTCHLEHKVLFSLDCFHTFKCHFMHKKMALLKIF